MEDFNKEELTPTPDTENEAPVGEPSPESEKSGTEGIKKIWASVFDIFETFALCTAVIMIIFCYVARLTVVEGESMEDTLFENDYLIVQSIGYTPERGDIVVLHKIDSEYSNPLIKRVIAVEGDEVDIKYVNGDLEVYVNGKLLNEPYINDEDMARIPQMKFPLTVEEDTVFVMGDHRNHSADSRLTAIGLVDERCIVGRAIFRILPFDSIGTVAKGADYTN